MVAPNEPANKVMSTTPKDTLGSLLPFLDAFAELLAKRIVQELKAQQDPHPSNLDRHVVDLLTGDEAAGYLGLQPQTLNVWRSTRRYAVHFIKVGRLVKYRRSDLDAWL